MTLFEHLWRAFCYTDSSNAIPEKHTMNTVQPENVMSHFISEIQLVDLPRTLHNIAAEFLRVYRTEGVTKINFMSKNDEHFYFFRKILD